MSISADQVLLYRETKATPPSAPIQKGSMSSLQVFSDDRKSLKELK
jgi:hypothetical protein